LQFGSFPQRQYYRWLLFPALKTARQVATVSHTAKKELEHWMELEGLPKSFAVIPNVVTPNPIGQNPTNLQNFFFCLSNSKPHKNVEWLRLQHQAAFARGGLPMVANVGGNLEEWRAVKPNREEIGALYAEARAFFFPSLYEGFGRPPVEAALLGTLPVVSDIPVHREALAGVKETIFLPLHDEQLWVQTMLELSEKPKIMVSEQSRNWILQQYSPAAQRAAFLNFWQGGK
jgi:glycosyltransferase involved in cell wall biosynthesis